MEQYIVTGMSCAACQTRVEKAVSALEGVDSCSVSLLTNSMGVEGSASQADIIKAVENAGYGASPKNGSEERTSNQDGLYAAEEEALKDRETPILKKRLIWSCVFLILLMYISMGHTMWNWPVPEFFHGNHVGLSLLEMILSVIIMYINKKFFVSGFKSLIHRAPNMDTLVAMGSAVSFGWSTLILFKMTQDQLLGDMEAVKADMHGLYFEAAAMIVTLITVGKMLEAISKGRTTNALKGLMKLAPEEATLLVDGQEKRVKITEVAIGDIFVVRPGESIPVDGVILEGSTAVDESALTGESIPVDKEAGDGISAATINQSGYIQARASRVGEDTTLSQIIHMVSDAAATKAPIAKIVDKVSGIFVPAVLIAAAITTLIWLLVGEELGYSLARGISVLVISCPCALGLATPVAIMVGNGMGARNGILFKTAESLEITGKPGTIVLDKTGTITAGEPVVTDLIPSEGKTAKEILFLAGSLESRSEHPLARAVMKRIEDEALEIGEPEEFQALPGNGLSGRLDGEMAYGGNAEFLAGHVTIPAGMQKEAERLAEEGKTCLYFGKGAEFYGMIAVADTIKADSPEAIRQLKGMGYHVVMLTGDNQRTAEAVGRQAGVDEVIAGVKPDGKDAVVKKLQKQGKVLMVGDGINDAPALTRADVGVAIGAGTDVAIDAADVVVMNSKLLDVAAAIRLSRATVRNIHENLFWAFIYNVILIPVAAGAYVHLTGWTMNPMLGAAAMSLSSFCVCVNALRLNLFRLYDSRKDKNIKVKVREVEETEMEKKMNIEGMMCTHCEATVKKALEALEGVDSAEVSHEAGTAVVSLNQDVTSEVLTKAVEDKDYKVLSVE